GLMSVVRDRTQARRAAIFSRDFISGVLQTEAAARYITSLPFPGPYQEVTPADRDRVVRFRLDSQHVLESVPTEFIIAHSALQGVPPELRRSQAQHVVRMTEDGKPWSVRYISEGVALPSDVTHNFSVTYMPQGASAHYEGYSLTHDPDGTIVGLEDLTEGYVPVDSPEVATYEAQLATLGTLALNPFDSVEALRRMS
ncbi:MAG TPA: Scr1 family TA system antitoxin-like transcriptional regulator, partial [Candidatus Saccharimonadales bacterium]|nr:Scr1 family TA system antitoxin-like transcriptional regulator [Candidatus Saccharimonadales bacterium]